MAQDNFPVPGAVLWAVDVELNKEILRRGAASKPNVDFLRYSDLGLYESGRIEGEQADKHVVNPEQGVSLFLQRIIAPGTRILNDETRKTVPKDKQTKVHWWAIDQGHPIPSGLVLKYDGVPPGHCILTVVRPMTVAAFVALVALIPFNLQGFDIIGPV